MGSVRSLSGVKHVMVVLSITLQLLLCTVHHVYSNTVYIFEHNALNKPQVAAKI